MSDVNVIRVESLTVRYGRAVAVDTVNLDIPNGTVYALLGRNGAGKSSLVRCLVGQQKPEAGRVTLFGDDVWTRREKLMQRVGIVPEESDAPPEMTIERIAEFCRDVYSRWNDAAVRERVARFGLQLNKKFGTLSKGQKKQVMLAVALAMSPDLLILDDPTLGLDVVVWTVNRPEDIEKISHLVLQILVAEHFKRCKRLLISHDKTRRAFGALHLCQKAARPHALKIGTTFCRAWNRGLGVHGWRQRRNKTRHRQEPRQGTKCRPNPHRLRQSLFMASECSRRTTVKMQAAR